MKTISAHRKFKQSLFLLFFLTGMAFAATAQISIVDSDMPYVDDTVRVSTGLNLNFIDYTETGEDYLWDFSELLPINQRVDTFLSPWSMPLVYKLFFGLTSNLAVRGAGNMPIPGFPFSDIFNFYDNRSQNYRAMGLGISISGFPVPFNYDDPDVVYDFPVEFQNSWNSQAHFAQEVPVIGYLRMTKIHTDTVDGWGTLITPYGTFEVLRLKSDVHEYDSIYMDSLDIGIPITRDYTVYRWLGKGQKIPLLQITTTLGGVLAEYVDSVRTTFDAINEQAFVQNNEVKIFPNPTSGVFRLQFEMLDKQQLEVALFDLQGKEIALIYQGVPGKGKTNLSFDLHDRKLLPGAYIIRLRAGGSLITKKIIYQP
jgi:hypothetical protein